MTPLQIKELKKEIDAVLKKYRVIVKNDDSRTQGQIIVNVNDGEVSNVWKNIKVA